MFLALIAAISIYINTHYIIAAEYKLKVELSIPLDPDNRVAIVEWDGDGPRASSGLTSRQLDEYTDKTRHYFYIVLTPGTYQIRGRLLQSNGKQSVTETQTVEIIYH